MCIRDRKNQVVDNFHLLVQAAFFRHIANPFQVLALKALAEKENIALVG